MADGSTSGKRFQINKANTTMVVIVAIAAFLATFSIVASKALLDKRSYQNRVLTKKQKAADQLHENVNAVNSLMTAYKAFVDTSDNVIGGNPDGKGDRDGDNAKIVLDALPSQYDFPALASSLEKILAGYRISSISGSDDQIAQQQNSETPNPQPVEIPFQFSTTASSKSAEDLLKTLERSIRPIKVHQVTLGGDAGSLTIQVDASTYYQPEKSVKIEMETVK